MFNHHNSKGTTIGIGIIEYRHKSIRIDNANTLLRIDTQGTGWPHKTQVVNWENSAVGTRFITTFTITNKILLDQDNTDTYNNNNTYSMDNLFDDAIVIV